MFDAINWSTDSVCAQTLERAAELGLSVRLLPACYDVDDRGALHRLCSDLLGSGAAGATEIRPCDPPTFSATLSAVKDATAFGPLPRPRCLLSEWLS